MTLNMARVTAVVLIPLIAVVTAGCAPVQQRTDSDMDFPAAYAEVESLFIATKSIVLPVQQGGNPPSQAKDLPDSSPKPCTLLSGGTGERTQIDEIGPGVPAEEQEGLFRAVAQLWADAGFLPVRKEVVRSEFLADITLLSYVEEFDTGGVYLSFRVSDRSWSVTVRTRCVPTRTN